MQNYSIVMCHSVNIGHSVVNVVYKPAFSPLEKEPYKSWFNSFVWCYVQFTRFSAILNSFNLYTVCPKRPTHFFKRVPVKKMEKTFWIGHSVLPVGILICNMKWFWQMKGRACIFLYKLCSFQYLPVKHCTFHYWKKLFQRLSRRVLLRLIDSAIDKLITKKNYMHIIKCDILWQGYRIKWWICWMCIAWIWL